MKILLVNGYQQDSNDFKEYSQFTVHFIKQQILHSKFSDTETEFYYRTIDDLDDILYETDSGYQNIQNAHSFDKIDIVFIETHNQLKPWQKQAQKLMILIRMCLFSQKKTFCSNGAFSCLIFQSATNFDRKVNIVNGKMGGNISTLSQYSTYQQIKTYQNNDYFLDDVTGDLYSYIQNQKEWQSLANCGFHSNSAFHNNLVKKGRNCQYFDESFNYEYSQKERSIDHVISRNNEYLCQMSKDSLQHYLFKGINRKNVVLQIKQTWDIHSINYTNPNLLYKVIMHNEKKGPIVISYGSNDYMVGCRFQINRKYPYTYTVLKNFIEQQLNNPIQFAKKVNIKKVSEQDNKQYITKKEGIKVHQKIEQPDQINNQIQKVDKQMITQNIKIRPISSKNLQNSGINIRKLDQTFNLTDNNAIQQVKFKCVKNNEGKQKMGIKQVDDVLDDLNNTFEYSEQEENMNLDLKFDQKSNSITINKNVRKTSLALQFRKTIKHNIDVKNMEINSYGNHQSDQQKQRQSQINQSQKVLSSFKSRQSIRQSFNTKQQEQPMNLRVKKHRFDKCKNEVIQMLHPCFSKEQLPKQQKIWVPGRMQESLQYQKELQKSGQLTKVVRVDAQTKQFPIQKGLMLRVECDQYRSALHHLLGVGGVVLKGNINMVWQQEDQKILAQRRFVTDKPIENFIDNYVVKDFSEPVTSYKFRIQDRSRWVSTGDFISQV